MDLESSLHGLLRHDQNQTTQSSCHWVARKHFSLHSPFPFFRSTPTRTAGSASSASAPSVRLRRSRKKRSRRSSAPWDGDYGDWPPAASRNPSKAASRSSRSSP